jgi:hypothetical protein
MTFIPQTQKSQEIFAFGGMAGNDRRATSSGWKKRRR